MNRKSCFIIVGLVCSLIVGGGPSLYAVSDEEFQSLKNKVMQLERTTFPPERAEEIKKVAEYVCPQGHSYSTPPENWVCPLDGLKVKERVALLKVKLDRREAVGNKISAMLEEEFQKRVHVAVAGTGIVQHVTDALERETKRQTFAQGSVDLYLFSNPMNNSVFFIDIESQGGTGPDASVLNQSVLNNDTTSLPGVVQTDQVRLREAWIQKSGFSQKLQMIIGKIDVTNYFDRNRVANDETSQFISGVLVNNPVIGNPSNGPGAVILMDSRRGISFGMGVQSADASGVNVTEEPYSIAEVDFRSRYIGGHWGNFRLWGARNGRAAGDSRDDSAIGLSLDQEIGQSLILFGRVGRSFRKDSRDPSAWSAGFLLRDFLKNRRRDRLGLAYSRYLTPTTPGISGETESLGEIYYSLFLSDHLTLSPMGQYLFHSAGSASGGAQSNVFVLGLRTQVTF